ncbi:hypothetical protein EMIT047CA2_40091 [Pseudomonas soli]
MADALLTVFGTAVRRRSDAGHGVGFHGGCRLGRTGEREKWLAIIRDGFAEQTGGALDSNHQPDRLLYREY